MTAWTRTIDIKQHLDPDKPLAEVRDPIVATLRADPAYQDDPEFGWAVDEMAEAADVEGFNDGLSHLYDWADWNRVWIGPNSPSLELLRLVRDPAAGEV